MEDKKTIMRTIPSDIRNKTFEEVELGYSDLEAKKEAERCLNCNNPRCVKGCPVGIMIPKFIEAIRNNDLHKAYEIISESSNLPAVCGRVCPQEKQCEKMCIKGLKGDAIAIGSLERYVADYANENNIILNNDIKENGKKVAIIGSGPGGLSCAYTLRSNGFSVTIYEILHKLGGVLTYGIPEFRLPKRIVQKEVEKLKKIGVNIITDTLVGNTISINELKKEYDYIFIGTGAGLPKFMGIDGEDANEVFSANEILTRVNLMEGYKNDATTPIKCGNICYIIGGGNVAMDAVRTVKRLGMEAHLMYRRDEKSLPTRKMEVIHAKEEGIIFHFLENPTKILKDENNHVIGMETVNMKVLEEETDGKKKIVPEEESKNTIKCDMVVMALGTNPNKSVLNNSGIIIDDRGLIITEDYATNINNVYAGGDAVTGSATVILAMEAGKKAALKILEKEKMSK